MQFVPVATVFVRILLHYNTFMHTASNTISAENREAQSLAALAQQALRIEQHGIEGMRLRLAQAAEAAAFAQAVQLVLAATGRVVVMGMGKSGHIGRKIAATLASTGTPAMFVHPAEASHGDLGMITAQDVVLALSNSGESSELTVLLPLLRRWAVPVIAMTGGLQSALAQYATVVLDTSVEQEACPLNLAPTASTTAQLAMGDALAVVLLDARGFDAEDFARSHPGGALGRRLLTLVADVMRQGEAVAAVRAETGFAAVMKEMSAKGLGATAVVDAQNRPLGIFTDGDMRRLLEQGVDVMSRTAGDVMHAEPKTVRQDALAADAAALMERYAISSVLVTDAAGVLVGALNMHDLMRGKVI